MADWHKITKRIDSSAPIDRDFQPRVLNRDIENSILEPQSDLTTLDLEHNSVKHDISPLYRFENNYYRSRYQNMNYHQSTNNQSSRRHSVSNPQTKERTYISKSQNQGYSRSSLSTDVGSSYSSTPRTPDADMKKSFDFPSSPIRLRASSYSSGGKQGNISNLSIRFDDSFERYKKELSLSPRTCISPRRHGTYNKRALNDVSLKLDNISERPNDFNSHRRNSLENSTYGTPRRKRSMSISTQKLENLHEESHDKLRKLSTEKDIGLSPAKELRNRRRRLDSLHLDPPRLSVSSLPQDDHDSFHLRDIFHIREVFHLHDRLRALEWRTYLPTSYFQMMSQMQLYGRRSSDEGIEEDPPVQDDTIVEGQELYLHFFHEQLRKAGIENQIANQQEEGLASYHTSCTHVHETDMELTSFQNSGRTRKMSLNLENFQNPIWRQTGRDLKFLADQFANSIERIRVQERAEQVNIESLNREEFFSMLTELFQGGRVTRERILVLFFFCSDVAIRAIKSNSEGLLSTLTQWSLIFIKEQVCAWVGKNGGWQIVLRSGFNVLQQTIFVGACVAVIICSFIYIRKNISSSAK